MKIYSTAEFVKLLAPFALPKNITWVQKNSVDWILIGSCALFENYLIEKNDSEKLTAILAQDISKELADKTGAVLIISGCCGSYNPAQQEKITKVLSAKKLSVFFLEVKNLADELLKNYYITALFVRWLAEKNIISLS